MSSPPDGRQAISAMIASGQFDDHLDHFIEAIKARRKMLAIQAGMTLQVGQRVRFADVPDNRDGWVGVEGVVVKKSRDGSKTTVKLDLSNNPRAYGEGDGRIIPVGRRVARHDTAWTVPSEWLEVV